MISFYEARNFIRDRPSKMPITVSKFRSRPEGDSDLISCVNRTLGNEGTKQDDKNREHRTLLAFPFRLRFGVEPPCLSQPSG
jgi:hypothetical protein